MTRSTKNLIANRADRPHAFRTAVLLAMILLSLAPAVATAQYVAPVTSPQVDATSLKLWLDASYTAGILDADGTNANGSGGDNIFSGTVATWQDRSGNANNATQGTAVNQPTYQSNVLNLQDGVRFDAVATEFDGMTTGLNLTSPYSVFALFNYRNAGSAFRRAVQGSGGNNWLIGPYQNNVQHFANGWVSQSANPIIQNQFYLGTALNTGAISTFQVDGANRTTGAGSGSPGVVSLGASGTYAEPLDGDLVEVLAYNKVLSQAELSQVGLYFQNKYGLKNGLGNVATGATVINGAGSYPNVAFNAGTFPASEVTDGRTTDTSGQTYWLGQNEVTTGSFTLDLGSARNIQNIALLNTHNATSIDRGTRQFEIWASNSVDGGNNLLGAVKILSGQLSSTFTTLANDDSQPLDVFNSDTGLSPGSYRYLRFDALNRSFEWNTGNRSVGLNEIFVFEDKRLSNITAGKPVTASSTYPLPAEFQAINVVDQRYDDMRTGQDFDNVPAYGTRSSYWIAADGVTNATLTVDLQNDFRIDRIDLQNTHNGNSNDRGTQNFRIEASMDGIIFNTIFSGTLASGSGLGRNVPIITYSAAAGDFTPFHASYLRFVAINFYGTGSGLSEIAAFGVVPEPGSLAMLAFGAIGLWLFRGKRS